jgi:hypothetical protein
MARILSVETIKDFFGKQVETVRVINRKYAKPRIKTTRMVNIALLALRLYLVLLVLLLIYKFITLL